MKQSRIPTQLETENTRINFLNAPTKNRTGLFQLGFLVRHMLADDRIKFFHFELSRRGALVLARGVKDVGYRRPNVAVATL
jgi:hypothetical protein